MPAYQTTPFKASPALLVSGTPTYLLGSYNDLTTDTYGYIQTTAAVTTTATVVFQIVGGNAPAVGSKISVRGAGRSNNLNVTNGTILTVSTTDAGVCTVTYAIASTSLATLADGGEVRIPQPEVGETAANGSSVPAAAPFNNPNMQQGRTVTATVTFPTAPTTAAVYLQGAQFDIDSEYEDIGLVNGIGSFGTTGPSLHVADLAFRFYRFNTRFLTGAGTVVGKLSC